MKATIAQLAEHLTCNEDVPGSTPGGGSNFNLLKDMLAVGFTTKEISDRISIEIEEINMSDFKPQEL